MTWVWHKLWIPKLTGYLCIQWQISYSHRYSKLHKTHWNKTPPPMMGFHAIPCDPVSLVINSQRWVRKLCHPGTLISSLVPPCHSFLASTISPPTHLQNLSISHLAAWTRELATWDWNIGLNLSRIICGRGRAGERTSWGINFDNMQEMVRALSSLPGKHLNLIGDWHM